MPRGVLVLLLSALSVSPHPSHAGPSQTSGTTPTNRFRQFEGTWLISDNSGNALDRLKILISQSGEGAGAEPGVFALVDSSDFVQADLDPKPKTLRQSELKGTYATREANNALRDLIGPGGQFIFSFSPFTDGRTFTGTFFPNPDSGAPQISFGADRVGGHRLRVKIVNQVKFRGKRKAGQALTVAAKFINRGPGTLLPTAGAAAGVEVDGDIESGEVVFERLKGLDGASCETDIVVGERFVAGCPFEYVGPPPKSTNALLTVRVVLAATAAGSRLEIRSNAVGGTANLDSRPKLIKLKVAGTGEKHDGAGGIYSGTWRCSSFGTITMTQKGNDITSGSFTSDSPAEWWFPPNDGTVANGFVTLETKTATIKLDQHTGGFTQLDVRMADDNQSFSGNFLVFGSDMAPIIGAPDRSTCVKQS